MHDLFVFTLSEDSSQNEIKTPVKLRNPLTSKEIACDAIWDTGATSSMISNTMASALSLKPTGQTSIVGVHGTNTARCYVVNLVFCNGVVLPEVKVAEASNVGGFGFLVGMDIIGRGVLHVDGTTRRLEVRFELPIQQ